ncbi:uncharacterized protein VTP21DRAFT_7780 [Calcarisporiella thermophila]|uniref:uncharacterized protein n=1 Tax=Calcarisporiella thermophila TaxID=911321 RepID=UPI003743CB55
MEDLTLNGHFKAGQALYQKLEDSALSSTDPIYIKDLAEAIDHFEKCTTLAQHASLFSSNESLEDMATSDLKFLLVEAYLGELILKRTDQDRENILNTAKSKFEQFLFNCEMYDILTDEDKLTLEKQRASTPSNQASLREQKIARFKREKATKARIDSLQQLLTSSPQEDSQNLDREMVERELVLALLDLFVQKALEEIESIGKEMKMVEEMKHLNLKTDTRVRGQPQDYNDRLEMSPSGPLLSKEGKPLRPFVIMSQREQLKQQVFRPGWALPTMTIDEYLEQERQRGNIISGGGKEPEKKEIDDNDEEAIDKETYKQRSWDDFKDNNPKGWGNRMNKG